jgi:hypothetical protein
MKGKTEVEVLAELKAQGLKGRRIEEALATQSL